MREGKRRQWSGCAESLWPFSHLHQHCGYLYCGVGCSTPLYKPVYTHTHTQTQGEWRILFGLLTFYLSFIRPAPCPLFVSVSTHLAHRSVFCSSETVRRAEHVSSSLSHLFTRFLKIKDKKATLPSTVVTDEDLVEAVVMLRRWPRGEGIILSCYFSVEPVPACFLKPFGL